MNDLDLAGVAALIGEPARAMMLAALFDGRSMPAGELARAASITAATASAHSSKLMEGGLVRVQSQGRHRYYRLARPEVAEALEAIGSIARPTPAHSLGDSLRMQRLRFARSCYDHLAGELAIAVAQALVRSGAIESDEDGFRLCDRSREIFLRAGIDTSEVLTGERAHIRACIDWTERRHHISGPLGAALLRALLDANALRRRAEPRALELTESGPEHILLVFGIDLTVNETIAAAGTGIISQQAL